MNVIKEACCGGSAAVDQSELEQINRFSRKELTADEVYTFAVRLCDNEVDRDGERFENQTLDGLAELFVGKTGIFDHNWSAGGQTARIYRTEVAEGEGVTVAGDGYRYCKGWAYMLKNEKNEALIAEIEGGIKKEVSVGCSVSKRSCSVCGAESGTCHHVPGQMYGEQLCFTELKEPVDAYEWSFVAVPAQRNAGVVKRFGRESEREALLRKQAALGRKYLRELRREVVRLAMMAEDDLDGTVFAGMAERLEEAELQELKKAYEVRAAKRFPAMPQLRAKSAERRGDESVFLV